MSNHEQDAWAAELWSDDPEVTITDGPVDANPPHGHNDPQSLEAPDARFLPAVARFLARLGLR